MSTPKDWKFTISNITKEQAEILASWYSGQGEQDADIWFDYSGHDTPWTDDVKTSTNNETKEVVIVAK